MKPALIGAALATAAPAAAEIGPRAPICVADRVQTKGVSYVPLTDWRRAIAMKSAEDQWVAEVRKIYGPAFANLRHARFVYRRCVGAECFLSAKPCRLPR